STGDVAVRGLAAVRSPAVRPGGRVHRPGGRVVTPRNVVIEGDAATVLAGLADNSVETALTSPAYFQARFYNAGPAELGREETVDEWVAKLLAISREIARVLAPT